MNLAGAKASSGRFELVERLGRITAVGVTQGPWIPVHLHAPFGITVAGIFTGSIQVYGSNSLDPPADELPVTAYAPVGEVLTSAGSQGGTIPYHWMRYVADITSFDGGTDHIDVDFAGYTPSGQRGG